MLPKSTCPLVKASVGARLGKTCPFFRIADMYVGETTCDGKKKAYEILGEDVPMYIMDVPQMKREKDIVKWKEEIAEFAKTVEEFTGNEITVEKLNEAIKVINAKRKALQRVYDCRKSARSSLVCMETISSVIPETRSSLTSPTQTMGFRPAARAALVRRLTVVSVSPKY